MTLERWLQYAIVTPGLHTVHHSSNRAETDSNFSAVFPVWDLLLGTFRSGERPPAELGLKEYRGSEVDSFRWLLASPLHRTPTARPNAMGTTI
jgi:sterol desaturase/sphingolipid hydroxylase (fatty acid hydroxylase superfamily)